ncbi:hypothetical protein [Bradyrhizobium sp. CSS354]|uniref:hypothetical protein n=1 Tax=Bradyrhizobium sp. CSS354 TaxID=2699172 RepID=UPI0023B1DFA8|nr:hypothetical protein [Bradyrhizobium sp. CSS354]MDE5466040.1 hypothetical protein [Bradyrhizobium sp. CSS354]
MTNPNCPICFGLGFVCENHPDRAWSEELGCQCGAGDPCACNRSLDIDAGIEEPDVSHIIEDAGVKKPCH